MSALLVRLTNQLRSRGVKDAKSMAIALLKKRGQMDKSSLKLTPKGKSREDLGNAGRAKDRSAKYSGRDASDFKYDKKTNAANLKKDKK